MGFHYVRYLVVLGLLVIVGCARNTESKSNTEKVGATTPEVKHSDVVKIVFVGQKDSCDCTRDRIDKSWKSLSSVMATRQEIAVERIQLDVDTKKADALDDLRTLMVAPGVYYFDVNEQLVEMQQGELTSEQILKVL